MPKLKVGHAPPIPEEEAAINAGIAADSESRELGDDWFTEAKPASELLSPETYARLTTKRQRGRPKADATKVFTAIRLDADLLDAFRTTGRGWQTRMNAALRHYLIESGNGDVGISTMFRVEGNQFIPISATRTKSKERVSHEAN